MSNFSACSFISALLYRLYDLSTAQTLHLGFAQTAVSASGVPVSSIATGDEPVVSTEIAFIFFATTLPAF